MKDNNNCFYKMDKTELFNLFKSKENGLSKRQVKENLKKFGKNEIEEKKKKGVINVFFSQFKDILVLILVISAIISIFINELHSTIVIFLVLSINASLGTYQYFKAEKSILGLKNLSNSKLRVKRDGVYKEIDSKEVVCGDIFTIESGDVISCDARIIESSDLEMNESSLTGESFEVSKNSFLIHKSDLSIGEISNMVFSGTFCVKGSATLIACAVGHNTEIGKIANMIKETKEKKTPLQRNLDKFSKVLASVIIFVCFIVFILGIYRHNSIFDSLMFSVSLAVAAIPEALSTIVVIVLAIGMEKMAKENAIIKDLKAVEGLGSVSVIASDKTGTITEDFMEVKEIYSYLDEFSFKKYLMFSLTNSNKATEKALKQFVYDKSNIKNNGILKKEMSFQSDKKMSSNIYLIDGKEFIFVKGACEKVLNECKYILRRNAFRSDADIISQKDLDNINLKINEFSSKGFRVLSLAYKQINNENNTDLIFIGLIALYNPLRKEVKESIKDCRKAKIKTIMLTGDYLETAKYIAKEANILDKGDVLLGEEINKLSDDQLKEKIKNTEVCARLDPIHKIRIVKALQANNEIVAMTGDGINDAPSLKQADVSIAMGNGTGVAKDVSNMILADNNFNTIVNAISNGRTIYLNIQNSIIFLLSGNLAAIILVLLTCFLSLPVPFASVHLLFINLLTDSLPAIAIGLESSPKDVLLDSPREKNNSFLSRKTSLIIIIEGIFLSLACAYAYYFGLKYSIACARTMTFLSLCLARLLHSFNCSTSDAFIVNLIRFKKINWCLILSFLIGFVLVNAVILVPEFSKLLQSSILDENQIIIVYVCSFFPFVLIQIFKIIFSIFEKIKKKSY